MRVRESNMIRIIISNISIDDVTIMSLAKKLSARRWAKLAISVAAVDAELSSVYMRSTVPRLAQVHGVAGPCVDQRVCP